MAGAAHLRIRVADQIFSEDVPAGVVLSQNPPAHKPKKTTVQEEVIGYNISYLYIAGFKAVEPTLVAPAPLLGDEANCLDSSVDAWNGNAQDLRSANRLRDAPDDRYITLGFRLVRIYN